LQWERVPREIAVTVREIIKLIEADGWYLARQRSSHRQFKHPTKPGLVTVAGHPPKELAPKTLKSIYRQAGLTQ
jgi:predicted RNA binding protein YcfA (HicA-like mRNA interferase family)